MAVRRKINRYKTEPYGQDFNDVLKRAKAFFKDGTFYITESKDLFFAHTPSLPPFKVKILDCFEDEGAWCYEVTPTDWEPIGVVNREVPQKALERTVGQ